MEYINLSRLDATTLLLLLHNILVRGDLEVLIYTPLYVNCDSKNSFTPNTKNHTQVCLGCTLYVDPISENTHIIISFVGYIQQQTTWSHFHMYSYLLLYIIVYFFSILLLFFVTIGCCGDTGSVYRRVPSQKTHSYTPR